MPETKMWSEAIEALQNEDYDAAVVSYTQNNHTFLEAEGMTAKQLTIIINALICIAATLEAESDGKQTIEKTFELFANVAWKEYQRRKKNGEIHSIRQK